MAGETIERGEGSSHQIAYKLMTLIAQVEGRTFDGNLHGAVDREWILQTYSQCKLVVDNGWDAKSILNERPLPPA